MAVQIPHIDFRSWGLGTDSSQYSNEAAKCASEIVASLQEFGCVVLQNHGVDHLQVKGVFEEVGGFFKRPLSEKMQYVKPPSSRTGFHPLGTIRVNPKRPVEDLNEAFLFELFRMKPEDFPVDIKKQRIVVQLIETAWRLAKQVLRAMAEGLNLEDKDYFASSIRQADRNINMRYNYYCQVERDTLKDQVRFGEHKDLVPLTLLFGDGNKGLQIELSDGRWVDVVVSPGDILANCGELMEKWTADKIKAAKHRVILPEGPERTKTRRSLAFFAMPDDDFLITCMDGSNKYEPCTFGKYSSGYEQAHKY